MLQIMIHDVHSSPQEKVMQEKLHAWRTGRKRKTGVIILSVDNGDDNDLPDSCMIYHLPIAQDIPSGNTM